MPYGYPEEEASRFMHNVISNQLHVVTTLSSLIAARSYNFTHQGLFPGWYALTDIDYTNVN